MSSPTKRQWNDGLPQTTPKAWLLNTRCWSEPHWPPRIIAMLLIVALLIIWQVFGAAWG